MTREQLLEECESMEPPKGYEFAVQMTSSSVAVGDTRFAEIAASVARDLLQKNLHKPGRKS